MERGGPWSVSTLVALSLLPACGGKATHHGLEPETDGNSAPHCTGASSLSNSSEGDAACVVKADGTLWCWGSAGCDSLGADESGIVAAPVSVPGSALGAGVASVSVGWGTTCAVDATGSVACWGNTLPPTDSCTAVATPTAVPGLPAAIAAVTTGYDHACALAADGSAWCWGANAEGQLGDGTTAQRASAQIVSGMSADVTAASAGYATSCAVKSDGSLWCWGSNFQGELGDGTTDERTTPVQVRLSATATSVSTSSGDTCAVDSDGGVWCWGNNPFGRLGDGGSEPTAFVPVQVALDRPAKAVSVGYSHTCALADDGSVWCWGDNDEGQLGRMPESCDTEFCPNPLPTVVSGLPSEVVAVTAGYFWTCALERDQTVWCWGRSADGELGDGTSVGRATPERVLPCGP